MTLKMTPRTRMNAKVFGITAPSRQEDPMQDSSRKKNENKQFQYFHSKEYKFICEIVSRFSVEKTGMYLKRVKEPLFQAHLRRVIENEQENLKKLKEETKYDEKEQYVKELEELREQYNKLTQAEDDLQRTYNSVNSTFARLVYECNESVIGNTAMFYQEDYERLLDLNKSQRDALRQREYRELCNEGNEALLDMLTKETKKNYDAIKEIEERIEKRKEHDKEISFQLSELRVEYENALAKKFNARNEDLNVKMTEIIEWVHNNDPFIAMNQFEDAQKKKIVEKSVYDLIQSVGDGKISDYDVLDPPVVPKLPEMDINIE